MNDDDGQKDVDPEMTTDKTPAQDEDEEDDKDEHGYLVLLSDDALSVQGRSDTKNHESDAMDQGGKAENEEKRSVSEKLIYSEVPCEYEKKGKDVVDHANRSERNKVDAMPVLSDKDEHGYLVVLPPLPSLCSPQNQADAKIHGIERNDQGMKTNIVEKSCENENLIYSEVSPEYEEENDGNEDDQKKAQ